MLKKIPKPKSVLSACPVRRGGLGASPAELRGPLRLGGFAACPAELRGALLFFFSQSLTICRGGFFFLFISNHC